MGPTKYEERIQDIISGEHEQLRPREEVGFKERVQVQVHRETAGKKEIKDSFRWGTCSAFRGRTGNFVFCRGASSSAFKETGRGSARSQEGCKDST